MYASAFDVDSKGGGCCQSHAQQDLHVGILTRRLWPEVDALGRPRTPLNGGPCSYRTSVITDCFYLLYLAPILAKPPTMPPPKGVAVAGQYWNH